MFHRTTGRIHQSLEGQDLGLTLLESEQSRVSSTATLKLDVQKRKASAMNKQHFDAGEQIARTSSINGRQPSNTPLFRSKPSISDRVRTFARNCGFPITVDPKFRPLRVLVSDDDRQLNKLMSELLRTWSRRATSAVAIECAFDGVEAEERIAAFMPNIVLLDLTMPRLDGFSVCRKVKEEIRTSHIRIVAMSGEATQERIDRILEAGADRFVRKPFSSAELIEACGLEAMARSSPRSVATSVHN